MENERTMDIDIEIDVERFIYEIQIRPGIWDMQQAAYAKRDQKKALWDEISDIFIDKEDASAVEKDAFGECSLSCRIQSLSSLPVGTTVQILITMFI